MDLLLLFAPLVVLLIIVWFGFVGCGSFGTSDPPKTESTTPGGSTQPTTTYRDVVKATQGFAVLWQLDEIGSTNVAIGTPPSPPTGPNGVYAPGVTLADDKTGAVPEKGNAAPKFTGTNGFIDVNYVKTLHPASNVSFTVELWMKMEPSAVGDPQVLVSSKQGAQNDRRGYEVALLRPAPNKRQIRAQMFAPPNASPGPSEVKIDIEEDTSWRHIVFVYNGPAKTMTLYVRDKGAPQSEVSGSSGAKYQEIDGQVTVTQAKTLRIGAGHKANGQPTDFFVGWLDEIAFYNAALTSTEVNNHFDKAKP